MNLIRGVVCWFNPAHVKKFYVKREQYTSIYGNDELTEIQPFAYVVYADEIPLKYFKYELRNVGTIHKGEFGREHISWKLAPDCDKDKIKNEAHKKAWAWLDEFINKINGGN